jgi:hypothetical protein
MVYDAGMKSLFSLVAAGCLALAAVPMPAFAQGVSSFTVVNMSGSDWQSLSVRRFGTEQWRPVGPLPGHGSRTVVQFADPDCAFDVRAEIAGIGAVTWQGVNLCQVNAVILNRNARGAVWVDYQ